MKIKIICFDIDNTICKTIKKQYSSSKPYKDVIKKINQLYDMGYYIKIFTARYMGRCNEDVTKVNKIGYKKTKNQLIRWNLKFHELIMGKPSYDILVDDKEINFQKNWLKKIDKKLRI